MREPTPVTTSVMTDVRRSISRANGMWTPVTSIQSNPMKGW